uniref:Uncharacterized protein n=1 Tax=Anguilla anguilla TaxID=7936 RepID=A0A0E9PRE4_ANGAN
MKAWDPLRIVVSLSCYGYLETLSNLSKTVWWIDGTLGVWKHTLNLISG